MKLSGLKKVLPYFDFDAGRYFIKKGYVCVFEGFDEDVITMIHQRDKTKDEWRLYSMISDNQYVDDNIPDCLHVYQLTKVA